MTNIRAMLNSNDVSEYLKISPHGLEVGYIFMIPSYKKLEEKKPEEKGGFKLFLIAICSCYFLESIKILC